MDQFLKPINNPKSRNIERIIDHPRDHTIATNFNTTEFFNKPEATQTDIDQCAHM